MLNVRYYCYFSKLTGYARAAHDYLMALHRHGDVKLEICTIGRAPVEPELLEPRYAEVLPLVVGPDDIDSDWSDVEVIHATPRVLSSFLVPKDVRAVALTTWETHQMPAKHVETLRRYSAVITPSAFCRDVITDGFALDTIERGIANPDAGAWPPVHVVPHCFEPGFWRRALHITKPKLTPFTFYSLGAAGARKNNRGLLKAYLHAFCRADHTNLVLIVPPGTDMTPYHSIIARSGIPQDELPGITVVDRHLTESELLDLHRGGACYISAARGEGWGLGLFDAALLQKPIVTPLWGGQRDFLGSEFEPTYEALYPVISGETPAFPDEESASVTQDAQGRRIVTARVDMAAGIDCRQMWAEPDLADLANRMHEARADVLERGMPNCTGSRRRFEATYSYAAVGPQLTRVLEEIARG